MAVRIFALILEEPMLDERRDQDAEIIHAAYAERVRELFKVFAENLAVGQSEQSCKERFKRSLRLVRKTRDLALQATTEEILVEPGAPYREIAAEDNEFAAEPLSAEDQALIEQALEGTRGLGKPILRR